MVMPPARKPALLTPEEYLAIEEKALEKSEFHQGEMYAMAGASLAHNRLTIRLGGILDRSLSGSACWVCGSDLRIHIPASGLFTYPDLVVVCGPPELAPFRTGETITNPSLIVEILSPSTEAYDRAQKFENHRTIDSLREYVLLSQSARKVEHYSRQPSGQWLLTDLGENGMLQIPGLDISIPVASIYEDIPLAPEPRFRLAKKKR